jgi:hypothetical protein
MKTNILTIAILVLGLAFSNPLSAQKKSNVEYHPGKVILKNGIEMEGLVGIKKDVGEFKILFKKFDESPKIYTYPSSGVKSLVSGDKVYHTQFIKTNRGNYVHALLEKVAGNDAVLFDAKFFDVVQRGKNNSSISYFEKHLLVHNGEYVFLNESDFKATLQKFWIDELALLEKLNQYDKVTTSELKEILN